MREAQQPRPVIGLQVGAAFGEVLLIAGRRVDRLVAGEHAALQERRVVRIDDELEVTVRTPLLDASANDVHRVLQFDNVDQPFDAAARREPERGRINDAQQAAASHDQREVLGVVAPAAKPQLAIGVDEKSMSSTSGAICGDDGGHIAPASIRNRPRSSSVDSTAVKAVMSTWSSLRANCCAPMAWRPPPMLSRSPSRAAKRTASCSADRSAGRTTRRTSVGLRRE